MGNGDSGFSWRYRISAKFEFESGSAFASRSERLACLVLYIKTLRSLWRGLMTGSDVHALFFESAEQQRAVARSILERSVQNWKVRGG